VHFLQNLHWTTWSRGIQVLPPQGSCNSFVFLGQLAWGNYWKITSSISSVHKINCSWKNNYILDLGGEGRTFNHWITFCFRSKKLCKKNTYNINHSSGTTTKILNTFLIEHDLATALSLVLHLMYESCLLLVLTCFWGVLYIKWK